MQTVDLIKEVVKDIKAEVLFDSISLDPVTLNYNITSRDTFWLMNNQVHKIDGDEFRVVNFIFNKSFDLKPLITGSTIVSQSIKLSAPTFRHGTLKMVKKEVNAVDRKGTILPMVYLYEIIRDRKVNDAESAVDRETDLRLYFLDSAKAEDWLTASHYEEVIKPMQELINSFLGVVKRSRYFTDIFDFDTINLVNASENGRQEKSIFDFDLSGIELLLFAEIRKDLTCNQLFIN